MNDKEKIIKAKMPFDFKELLEELGGPVKEDSLEDINGIENPANNPEEQIDSSSLGR